MESKSRDERYLLWTRRASGAKVKQAYEVESSESSQLSCARPCCHLFRLSAPAALRLSHFPESAASLRLGGSRSRAKSSADSRSQSLRVNCFRSQERSTSLNGVPDSGSDYLSLEKRFIWKQPETFLDFAVLKTSSPAENFLVLEPNRAVFYKLSNDRGELLRTVPIPESACAGLSRSPRAQINLERNSSCPLAGIECSATEPDFDGHVECSPERRNLRRLLGGPPERSVPGNPGSLGIPITGSACQGQASFYLALTPAIADWTQTGLHPGRT